MYKRLTSWCLIILASCAACYVAAILVWHRNNTEIRRHLLRGIDECGGHVLFADEYHNAYGADISHRSTHNGNRDVYSVIFNGDKCTKQIAIRLDTIQEMRLLKVGGKAIDDECAHAFSKLPRLNSSTRDSERV